MKYPDDFMNKIICGDCLEIIPEMPDGCVDMVLTSPPYDDLRDYGGYKFNFQHTAKELLRILKKGAVIVWIVGDSTINGSETGTSLKQVLYFKDIGLNLHDSMIYFKQGFSNPSFNRYHQVFEYMFILSKGQPKTFNPIKDRLNRWRESFGRNTSRQKDGTCKEVGRKRRFGKYGMRFNIWEYHTGFDPKNYTEKEHPAIFPYQLASDHIKSWSQERDIVLDPLIGSGTTARAAKDLKRNFIGIEINPDYCKIAEERLAQGVL